jgi:hypothetical protein
MSVKIREITQEVFLNVKKNDLSLALKDDTGIYFGPWYYVGRNRTGIGCPG